MHIGLFSNGYEGIGAGCDDSKSSSCIAAMTTAAVEVAVHPSHFMPMVMTLRRFRAALGQLVGMEMETEMPEHTNAYILTEKDVCSHSQKAYRPARTKRNTHIHT